MNAALRQAFKIAAIPASAVTGNSPDISLIDRHHLAARIMRRMADVKPTALPVSLALALALCGSSVRAQTTPAQTPRVTTIITLGTAGGPRPRTDRSQSSNMLIVNNTRYLIDAGEGTLGQITKAGIDFESIDHVFITHNHSDHNLGLSALIVTDWEYQRRRPFNIYGPLGTRAFVHGVLAELAVNVEIRSAEGFPEALAPLVQVNEVRPGVIYRDENVVVSAVQNSHFNFKKGTKPYGRHMSLSYRFDTASRSVVFTGDTGPSAAVTALAKGADTLVTEIADPEEIVALYKRNGIWARKSPAEQEAWLRHQQQEHLTPEAIAQMATAAGVRLVILTHFTPSATPGDDFERRAERVRRGFTGIVVAARDLQQF